MSSKEPTPRPTPGEPEFFTRAEAARVLRMSVSTLDRCIRTKKMQAAKRPGRFGRVLIAREALYAALEARRRGEI